MTLLGNRRAGALALSCAVAVTAALALAGPAGATSPGDLDPHFGDQGTLVGPHVGGGGIAMLPKGGFLVAGAGTFHGKERWVVTKWTAKGKPDTSFGGGDGLATFSFPGFPVGGGDDVAVVANGKVVVGGNACDSNSVCDFAAARLRSNGKLDHTFSGDGRVTTDFFGSDDFIDGMVVRPSGKIVLMGDAKTAAGDFDLGLVQYKKNGTLDGTFGTGGKVAQTSANDAFWEAVALDSTGRVIAAGAQNGPGGSLDFVLAAFLKNGHPDTSFGTSGLVDTDFSQNYDVADGLVVLPDGSILAAGEGGTSLPGGGGTDQQFGIAKYLSNGTLDTSFGGGDGLVTTNFVVPGFDRIDAIAVQSDGKIVAAGGSDPVSGNRVWVVARYLANGDPDTAFGTNGSATTDLTSEDDQPSFSGAGIEPNGRIVVSGYGGDDPALAGYVG